MTPKQTAEILRMNKADRAAAMAAMNARLAAKTAQTMTAPVRPAHVTAAIWNSMNHAARVALVNAHNENVAYRATICGSAV